MVIVEIGFGVWRFEVKGGGDGDREFGKRFVGLEDLGVADGRYG